MNSAFQQMVKLIMSMCLDCITGVITAETFANNLKFMAKALETDKTYGIAQEESPDEQA